MSLYIYILKKILLYYYFTTTLLNADLGVEPVRQILTIFSSNIVNDNQRSPLCTMSSSLQAFDSNLQTWLKPDSTR